VRYPRSKSTIPVVTPLTPPPTINISFVIQNLSAHKLSTERPDTLHDPVGIDVLHERVRYQLHEPKRDWLVAISPAS
jgi:hypothetical protein